MENTNKEYTHEKYRELMKDARIYDGTHNCYFCTGCNRYIPKKKETEPCPFCGTKDWHLDNPLRFDIINTEPLARYMFQTFRSCIEPFTGFDKQYWKCGNIFYKFSGEERLIQADKEHIKDVELWGVSQQGFSGYFISLCLRWKQAFLLDGGEKHDNTYLKFLTFSTNHIFRGECDCQEKYDDEFYFNLIFEDACIRQGYLSQLCFKAINGEGKEYDAYVYVNSCCDSMSLYDNDLIGSLNSKRLAEGNIAKLMTCLDDFTLIPRYWGCEY